MQPRGLYLQGAGLPRHEVAGRPLHLPLLRRVRRRGGSDAKAAARRLGPDAAALRLRGRRVREGRLLAGQVHALGQLPRSHEGDAAPAPPPPPPPPPSPPPPPPHTPETRSGGQRHGDVFPQVDSGSARRGGGRRRRRRRGLRCAQRHGGQGEVHARDASMQVFSQGLRALLPGGAAGAAHPDTLPCRHPLCTPFVPPLHPPLVRWFLAAHAALSSRAWAA